METQQATAALYLRKSSLDDRVGDNRSITDQRHDLEQLAMQAVMIEQLRREIEALSNGHQPEVAEAVLGGAEN